MGKTRGGGPEGGRTLVSDLAARERGAGRKIVSPRSTLSTEVGKNRHARRGVRFLFTQNLAIGGVKGESTRGQRRLVAGEGKNRRCLQEGLGRKEGREDG